MLRDRRQKAKERYFLCKGLVQPKNYTIFILTFLPHLEFQWILFIWAFVIAYHQNSRAWSHVAAASCCRLMRRCLMGAHTQFFSLQFIFSRLSSGLRRLSPDYVVFLRFGVRHYEYWLVSCWRRCIAMTRSLLFCSQNRNLLDQFLQSWTTTV